eukprot:SAG31_NODE_4291_length_3376_cov_1.344522_3_plen_132_part_00
MVSFRICSLQPRPQGSTAEAAGVVAKAKQAAATAATFISSRRSSRSSLTFLKKNQLGIVSARAGFDSALPRLHRVQEFIIVSALRTQNERAAGGGCMCAAVRGAGISRDASSQDALIIHPLVLYLLSINST